MVYWDRVAVGHGKMFAEGMRLKMKVSWEKVEKHVGVLTVEVDAEQVAQALDKAFRKVVMRVNVPGFRRGKVPRRIFEARFGVQSLYSDAIDILLPEAYRNAVEQSGIEPVDRPEVDVEQFEKDQPFIFKAKVTVKPEVKLGEYKGLEVPAEDTEVTEEELEKELERLQHRHAELQVVEGEPAQMGDLVSINYEGMVDGEPFEGGTGEYRSLELGSGRFIPGFEEQIAGMNVGEEKEIHVTFPEDYKEASLAGKPAVFKVRVNEIKRKILPQLDDEFAKDVSEFETLDEFKRDLAEKMKERKAAEAERKREAALVEKAAQNAEVDIPEVMIEREIDRMVHVLENRLRFQGMNLQLYYQLTGRDEASARAEMREEAQKNVLHRLVLEAIAKAEQLDATEEDLQAELERLAEVYNRSVGDLRDMFSADGYLEELKSDLRIRKAVKFLVEQSKSA